MDPVLIEYFGSLEGEDVEKLEEDTQETFDSHGTVQLGSGPIDVQRLSGYVTSDGIYKIFFYDENNKLKCMESNDAFVWKVADNF